MDSADKKHKKKPTKIEDMSKEQIQQAILKRRECNAKAQSIVESLLEKDITEDFLLKCLIDINQSHFEDVVEERAIIRLCGYPLCQQTLSVKDIPKQTYRISIRTNKVYDITTRKRFCSNICYKSAMYIKKQMLTSPLWFREYEEIPRFKLLPLETVGSLGQEVDLGIAEKIDMKFENTSFISVNDFTSASYSEINHASKDLSANTVNVNSDNTKPTLESQHSKESLDIKTLTNNKQYQQLGQSKLSNTNENKCKLKEKKSIPDPCNIVGEIIEKPEKKIDPILIHGTINNDKAKLQSSDTKQNIKTKPALVTAIVIQVEKCLAEWFTLDTMLFIFGEEKVKQMVAEKGECIEKYMNNYAQSISYNANTYDQYQELCRKLNMLELEERRNSAQTLNKEMKPLPDYRMLEEESKRLQLKVKAFMKGETEIPEPKDTNIEKTDDDDSPNLPLVDKNAQNALRRRIVCQHLNKVLPDLLKSLGLLTLTISSDVRLLVNTFKLRANNIMFKPMQWTLIAIVFIKLLSLRNTTLECLLEQPMAFNHMQLLLLSFKQDGGYLDRLITCQWSTGKPDPFPHGY
ncbi:unnamed protein product [Leptidea sinapis]|uniref:RNA polymerase II subunit B1 CTD phosphatase RPAP2 homolog n=1 Tax=Leptidea sinapis TaxID=189913 RepID=A0A5E4QY85_9NEOP|nr:unnamed protein product [Leptidea sinapis]